MPLRFLRSRQIPFNPKLTHSLRTQRLQPRSDHLEEHTSLSLPPSCLHRRTPFRGRPEAPEPPKMPASHGKDRPASGRHLTERTRRRRRRNVETSHFEELHGKDFTSFHKEKVPPGFACTRQSSGLLFAAQVPGSKLGLKVGLKILMRSGVTSDMSVAFQCVRLVRACCSADCLICARRGSLRFRVLRGNEAGGGADCSSRKHLVINISHSPACFRSCMIISTAPGAGDDRNGSHSSKQQCAFWPALVLYMARRPVSQTKEEFDVV